MTKLKVYCQILRYVTLSQNGIMETSRDEELSDMKDILEVFKVIYQVVIKGYREQDFYSQRHQQ